MREKKKVYVEGIRLKDGSLLHSCELKFYYTQKFDTEEIIDSVDLLEKFVDCGNYRGISKFFTYCGWEDTELVEIKEGGIWKEITPEWVRGNLPEITLMYPTLLLETVRCDNFLFGKIDGLEMEDSKMLITSEDALRYIITQSGDTYVSRDDNIRQIKVVDLRGYAGSINIGMLLCIGKDCYVRESQLDIDKWEGYKSYGCYEGAFFGIGTQEVIADDGYVDLDNGSRTVSMYNDKGICVEKLTIKPREKAKGVMEIFLRFE